MIDYKKEFTEIARDREKLLWAFCDLSDEHEALKEELERVKEEIKFYKYIIKQIL